MTKSLLFISLAFIVSTASAETLCSKNNLVQVFKNKSCPKGYSKISKSVLGLNVSALGSIDSKGDIGIQGDKGDAGTQGIKGITGEKGGKGQAGATGDIGDTGSKGISGTTGAKGPDGEKGDDGLSGPNFHGSTGNSLVTIADNAQDFWSINAVDGPSTSKGNTAEEIYSLFGNPCSKAEVAFSVSEAPGTDKSWVVSIAAKAPNGQAGNQNACTITGSNKSCVGTVVPIIRLPAATPIMLGITPSGSPTPVKAAWNVRCVLP